ncbi:hypothetical protein WA577_000935 [Blastocystis sp. JDR]
MHLYKREFCQRILKKFIDSSRKSDGKCENCHDANRPVYTSENCPHRVCFQCIENEQKRCPICKKECANLISDDNMRIILNNLIIMSPNADTIRNKRLYCFLTDVVVILFNDE